MYLIIKGPFCEPYPHPPPIFPPKTLRFLHLEVRIGHFTSTMVVTLHLCPLRSTDCAGVEAN